MASDPNKHKSIAETGSPAARFQGPLFLIGMPRSGTKLLRGLLVSHRSVGIPLSETEFLPYWIRHWPQFGDLSVMDNFLKFYRKMLRAPYFNSPFMKTRAVIDPQLWFQSCKSFTPAGVFEALIRHDAEVEYGSGKIWGDKSPSYITHLPQIKQHFPDARFVHIIRDARDYCLSINYAWGKNMIRAAQRWTDGIGSAQEAAKKFSADYLEVFFEKLLSDPESVMKTICRFVGIEYDSSMLNLEVETENIGSAKGARGIVRSNQSKYKTLLTTSSLRAIEQVAGTTLEKLGYEIKDGSGHRRVSRSAMFYYEILDGCNLFLSNAKRIGFRGTLKYSYGALTFWHKRR